MCTWAPGIFQILDHVSNLRPGGQMWPVNTFSNGLRELLFFFLLNSNDFIFILSCIPSIAPLWWVGHWRDPTSRLIPPSYSLFVAKHPGIFHGIFHWMENVGQFNQQIASSVLVRGRISHCLIAGLDCFAFTGRGEAKCGRFLKRLSMICHS